MIDTVEQARLEALAAEERWNEAHVALRAAWKRYTELFTAQRDAKPQDKQRPYCQHVYGAGNTGCLKCGCLKWWDVNRG